MITITFSMKRTIIEIKTKIRGKIQNAEIVFKNLKMFKSCFKKKFLPRYLYSEKCVGRNYIKLKKIQVGKLFWKNLKCWNGVQEKWMCRNSFQNKSKFREFNRRKFTTMSKRVKMSENFKRKIKNVEIVSKNEISYEKIHNVEKG